MTKICTSIEQSRKLIELGLSVDTADMWWNIDIVDKFGIDSYSDIPSCYNVSDTDIPAWSLSSLIELMPEGINNNTCEFSQLEIYKHHVCYAFADGNVNIGKKKDTLLDAVFEMVCWLLENNKI